MCVGGLVVSLSVLSSEIFIRGRGLKSMLKKVRLCPTDSSELPELMFVYVHDLGF